MRILKEGQVFKNYPHLCEEFLEVKPTKGKGRDSHFKELGRYCTYHTEKQKIIIDEVFQEPLPKIDRRKNNGRELVRTIYGTLMDDLIMDFITKNEPEEFYSFSQIFKDTIPIFNIEEYSELMNIGYEEFAEIHGMSLGLVKEYSGFMYGKVHGNFESALKRLNKQSLITYSKGIAIMRSKDECVKLATDDEIIKLRKCEDDTLEEMVQDGTLKKKSRYISNPKKRDEFQRRTIKKFNNADEQNKDSVFGYWNVYSFDLVNEDDENMEIKTDINKLILLYLKEIHKSIENKSYINDYGKTIIPYGSEEHKIDTYRLDQLLWNLPENWYEDFLHDYRFIFPEDNPDEMTETEMKEIGWSDNLQSIEENEDEGNEDIELIKKLEYLTNAEWNYVPTEQRKEWIPF